MKTYVNGISINIFGAKKNPALIFVHGFPYDYSMWNEQIKYFKNNYYCVAYDVRGLGKSRIGTGQFTMEIFVDDLFYLIKNLKIKKPVLIGLSMGGYIALRAAERNQEAFAAFVFADTHPLSDDNQSKLKRADAINTIDKNGLAKYVKNFLPLCFLPQSTKRSVYRNVLKKSLKQSPRGVKGAQLAMLSRTSTEEFLPKITKPTLVIVGEKDELTPPTIMEAMAKKIPRSQFVLIPDAAHMSPLENPAGFNRALSSFLEKLKF